MSSAFPQAQRLHADGKLDAALPLYEQCLDEDPHDWRALTGLGLLHLQQKRFGIAEELLQRSASLNPANPEAHAWLAEARRSAGRPEVAVASFREALRLRPDLAPAWFNLGLALAELGDAPGAELAWTRFLALRPGDARVRRELAGAAIDRGELQAAARWLGEHLARFPADSQVAGELASVRLRQGDTDAALALLQEVVGREPGNFMAAYQLAIAFDRLARLPSAIQWYERAASLAPPRADIQNALAVAHHNLAQHDEALLHYRKALEIEPGFAAVHSNLLMALHYVEIADEPMYREHLAWAERHVRDIQAAPRASFANSREPERRLRVGYVSPRFSAGPVARNFLPLLREHDAAGFHVTCYSTADAHDATTDEIRSHAHAWREVAALDDEALAQRIRDDAIDLLVDLSGHCPGHRLRMFARRAAPVQLTWLDYSSTTGIAAIDHFVGDPLQTPPGTEQRFVEDLVRLPDVRLCYRPPDDLPQVVPPPALRNGHVTFGCINRLSKLNAPLVATWSAILREVPGSRLLLKGAAYASAEVRRSVEQRFAAHRIAADRLDLREFSDEARMMAEYGDMDICLDPFPYNGSTTTCDALLMGVPVVTQAGGTVASRAGLMFLTACGMRDWIADNPAEYVRIACEGARDLPRLAALRGALRTRLLDSPVCDAPRFARAMEAIYRSVWRRFAAA